jgi:hypothetical protein
MQALAQWHLSAARFAPDADTSQWFASVNSSVSGTVTDRLKILQEATSQLHGVDKNVSSIPDAVIRDLARQTVSLFRLGYSNAIRELDLVRDIRVRLQPCLRDVWHDHVLFERDHVTGLIDPSACRTESVACDLSRLIGSLIADDEIKWDLALDEYHRSRPLSSGERALTAAFDRSGVLLSGWTWLVWLCQERRTFPDSGPVQQRLTDIVTRMSSLVTR